MMATILLSVALNTALAQDLSHQLVRHSDIADGRPSDLSKGFTGAYETEFGYTIAVGDLLEVSQPGGYASSTVVTSNNVATTVGSGYFQYLYNGTYAATVAKALTGSADPRVYMAPANLSGAEIRVTKIKLAGTRRRPVVWMECDLVNARDKTNLSGTVTIADYDIAARSGEIYSAKHITREIAIAKLREAKELLEMGVYDQAQFEAVKEKYSPYVSQ